MENTVGNLRIDTNLSTVYAASRWLYPLSGESQFIAGDLGVYTQKAKTLQDTFWTRKGNPAQNPGVYYYDGNDENPYRWYFAQYQYVLEYDIQTGEIINNRGDTLTTLEQKPDGTYPDPATDDLGSFIYNSILFEFSSTVKSKVNTLVVSSDMVGMAKLSAMSQQAYDNLDYKDPNTLYVITES